MKNMQVWMKKDMKKIFLKNVFKIISLKFVIHSIQQSQSEFKGALKRGPSMCGKFSHFSKRTTQVLHAASKIDSIGTCTYL